MIPTHNRAETLRNCLNSLQAVSGECDLEVVVVDNNSKDHTKAVAASFPLARYVFEKRTAFTRARSAGAEAARGDLLLYLDDDVLVQKGTLAELARIFTEFPRCGILAGRIDAQFEEEPPPWTRECQRSFNGWSLYNPDQYSFLKDDICEVPSAAGPMMGIRRDVYEKAGGFPPDTVGVETNHGPRGFRKLYVGPGDYGLSHRVRALGFQILYSPVAAVFHVIPKVRFTTEFWRSRMIGEGMHEAVTDRCFFHRPAVSRAVKCARRARVVRRYFREIRTEDNKLREGIHPLALWILYYGTYIATEHILSRDPSFAQFLWQIAETGVSDEEYEGVAGRFPEGFARITSQDFMYDNSPLTDAHSLSAWWAQLKTLSPGSLSLAFGHGRAG